MARTIILALMALTATVIAALGVSGETSAQSQPPAQKSSATTAGEPVFVELFTSQGCSSCPPADRLAARLTKEEGVVIISRPVDYWDRLGWKDTLASPANTALQRAYARRGLGGYNGVYTPQTVVAGSYGEVGSNERALRRQIAQARAQQGSAKLRVKPMGNGYSVSLAGAKGLRGDLVLMGVSSHEDITIRRGENRGRTIRYTNALIGEERVGSLQSGAKSVAIGKAKLAMAGADRYALVLRERTGGPVLAAAWLD